MAGTLSACLPPLELAMIRNWFRGTILPNITLQHLRTMKLRRSHPLGIIPAAPKRIVCEPTNACNLGCAFCGNKDMVRPWTYLPMPLYERLVEQMVELGIKRLTLHTVGEPTMHDQLVRMVEIAKEADLVVTLSTNGTLLDEDLCGRLVAAGPDILNLSLDTADDERFAAIRKGIDPVRVYENLRMLHRVREELATPRPSPWGMVKLPTLVATCVITPGFDRAEERAYFDKFGPYVDDVYFHFPNNHAGYVTDEPTKRHFAVPRRIMDALYKKVRIPCPYPWDAMFLLSDGTMSVCRFDFDARVKVGRFGERTLSELWNSEPMNDLRRAHMNFEFKDWSMCENCDGAWTANRHEYYLKTQRIKRRNGWHAARDGWLSQDPNRTREHAGVGTVAASRGRALPTR